MKLSKELAVLAVCGLVATSASAYTVSVDRYAAYYGGHGGGEFSVYSADLGGAYSPKALVSYLTSHTGAFQSFCLEENEGFSDTTTATLNTAAVLGGLGGGSPDPICRATAWLYQQFAMGVLSGYDYSAAGRNASAEALQNAIWALENELGAASYGAGLVALAVANVTNPYADANGDFGVMVLNMYDASGRYRQDMLVYLPDGGATLVLLGTSLVGVALMRRKQLA